MIDKFLTIITAKKFSKLMQPYWENQLSLTVDNCYCGDCYPTIVTIVDYTVKILESLDVIMMGNCKECGGKINRYLETGEVDKYREAIQKLGKG